MIANCEFRPTVHGRDRNAGANTRLTGQQAKDVGW